MKTFLVVALALVAIVPFVAAAKTDPAADAKVVAQATGGSLKALKGTYFDKDFEATVEYDAVVVDLNGDGQPEVFTRQYGGMFGMAGVQLQLYIKSKNGKWVPQFGFPGDYRLLTSKSGGFPDIEIVGPGTCFPVWRWNGTVYDLHKRCDR